MPPDRRDAALPWDMLTAAREITGFIKGCDAARFESDRKLRYAVERQLLVIGEAARRVSDSFKSDHPGIPRQNIVGLRNILAHDYGEVLVERVWLVASERIPELVKQIAPLIPPEPQADS